MLTSLLYFGLDCVNHTLLGFPLARVGSSHDFVKLFLIDIISLLLNSFLQLLDLFKVLTFLSVLGLHLEVFDCFVELLVLCPLFFLLKAFDLGLLSEETTLDASHVGIGLQHLSEEIVWA